MADSTLTAFCNENVLVMTNTPACPLCQYSGAMTALFTNNKKQPRQYWACPECHLAFMAPEQRLSAEAELAYYKTHQNSPDDAGYVQFLQQLWQPLQARLSPGMRGVDIGCGPVPTLSTLIKQQGWVCDVYDPFFYPSPWQTGVDFMTATECFEHFHAPYTELKRMVDGLNEGGWLAVMTERWRDADHFCSWHYPRDPTHVVFLHDRTLAYISAEFNLTLHYHDTKRVAIWQKNAALSRGNMAFHSER